jgi:hypothetical protein
VKTFSFEVYCLIVLLGRVKIEMETTVGKTAKEKKVLPLGAYEELEKDQEGAHSRKKRLHLKFVDFPHSQGRAKIETNMTV